MLKILVKCLSLHLVEDQIGVAIQGLGVSECNKRHFGACKRMNIICFNCENVGHYQNEW